MQGLKGTSFTAFCTAKELPPSVDNPTKYSTRVLKGSFRSSYQPTYTLPFGVAVAQAKKWSLVSPKGSLLTRATFEVPVSVSTAATYTLGVLSSGPAPI